jgi:hypothetical protein
MKQTTVFLLHIFSIIYDNWKLWNKNKKIKYVYSMKLKFNMQQWHDMPVTLTGLAIKQEEKYKMGGKNITSWQGRALEGFDNICDLYL